MKWPSRRKALNDRLVLSLAPDSLSYGRALNGRLVRCGVEARGSDTPQAFARRIRSLGLHASHVTALLPLHECQLLQIEAPNVPAAELKAAARWRIKDLVEAHLDDLTLDVMVVGDGRTRGARQLFVAAARSQAIRDVGTWCQTAGLPLSVIDVRETAQRNLQSAISMNKDRADSASAALMLHGDQCLLTICAKGELFYTRRLSWDAAALRGARAVDAPVAAHSRSAEELAMLDIVDYGADAQPGADAGGDVPSLVIELQRSLDLWERSWPDLPLERLLVQADGESDALAALLRESITLPVEVLRPEQVFADLAGAPPAVRTAVTPLVGGLLRVESRQL